MGTVFLFLIKYIIGSFFFEFLSLKSIVRQLCVKDIVNLPSKYLEKILCHSISWNKSFGVCKVCSDIRICPERLFWLNFLACTCFLSKRETE